MATLEDLYGRERAARIRREQARRLTQYHSTAKRGHLRGGDVRGYGEAPPPATVAALSPEQRALLEAKMKLALSALRTANETAISIADKWPTWNWLTVVASAVIPGLIGLATAFATPAEAKASVLGALRGPMRTQIAMREKSAQDVLNGTLDVSKWFTAVRETAKGIVAILTTLKDENTALNLGRVLDDIWNDIENGIVWFGTFSRSVVKKVPEALDKYGGLLALGGVVLVGLVLKSYLEAPLRYLPPPPRKRKD